MKYPNKVLENLRNRYLGDLDNYCVISSKLRLIFNELITFNFINLQ